MGEIFICTPWIARMINSCSSVIISPERSLYDHVTVNYYDCGPRASCSQLWVQQGWWWLSAVLLTSSISGIVKGKNSFLVIQKCLFPSNQSSKFFRKILSKPFWFILQRKYFLFSRIHFWNIWKLYIFYLVR